MNKNLTEKDLALIAMGYRSNHLPSPKASVLVLCVIVAVIAVLAYRFEPSSGMDLAKYYSQIELGNISHYGADYYGDTQNTDVFITIVMKSIVKYGLSSHVLGSISAIIYFGLIAKISLLWTRFRAKRVSPVLLFFIFVFSGYFLGFTGIRYGNACLLLILSFVYFELGRKYLSLTLSILSVCVHFSLLPLVGIFWGALLLPKKLIWGLSVVWICLTPWMIPVMQRIQDLFFSLGFVFTPIAGKMNSYIFESYGALPWVVRFLVTGETNIEIGTFWAGSRWWVGIGLVSWAALGVLLFRLKKEQKMVFERLPIEKIFPLLFAFMVFTIEAPAIPMRTLTIVRYLVILLLLPMFFCSKSILPKLYFFSITSLALLATVSGMEIVKFILGGY